MALKSLTQLKNLKNKTVIVRVDYNVPIKNGQVTDTERIERSFLTINYLLKKQAKIILISHLGKPDGKPQPEYSLKPVVKYLNRITRKKVQFINNCVGEQVIFKVDRLKPGQILLLENLRFYAEEEANEAKFAQELAALADIYVNDAFSACHRAHASIVGIPKYIPGYAGINLEDEIKNLSYLLKGFKRPAIAIIGGVKISTKIKVIDNLLKKYDQVLIGGALANNFLAVKGYNIGKSVFEKEYLNLAYRYIKRYPQKIILPIDVRLTSNFSDKAKVKIANLDELNKIKSKNFHIIDIGPKTQMFFEAYINASQTLVWNGPMGMFEVANFSQGSDYICIKFAIAAKGPAFGAVGGGETLSLLEKNKIKTWPDFVSTGGGAMLEFLEGKTLPGIKALQKK